MRDFLVFFFLLLLVVALIAVGVSYYLIHFARAPIHTSSDTGDPGEPVEVVFVVEQGQSTAEIAQNLADAGLIRSPWLFQRYARTRGLDAQLEAGRYVLRSDMAMDEILEILTNAPGVREVSFTIPEGMRLEQVVELLDSKGIVPASEFRDALTQPYDYDFLADRPEQATLEGYLFPDTYRVPETYTATQIVDFLLQNYDRKLDAELRQKAQDQGMSIYEVVTLASIVEREVVAEGEHPIVASVYLNRLEIDMALEADPTVQYAVGYNERQEKWWPVLYFDELGIERLADYDHAYNTYRHPGLPPGPICSPGLASLKAVVEPANTDYYFFVAKGDDTGEHAFARTLEEHNANVARYQQ
jgi:UPF0755 protein